MIVTEFQSWVKPRLFVAVPLSDNIKASLATWARTLRGQLPFHKWVHPADYHLTLQFLGPLSREQLKTVRDRLPNAARQSKPFCLAINRLGTFGQRRQPRILWAGVSGDREALRELQQNVVTQLEPLGVSKQNRPYRPHVTLARQYKQQDFHVKRLHSLDKPQSLPFSWQVKEIVVYQTHFGQKQMYEALYRFRF